MTLTGTTTPSQSGLGNIIKEKGTPQISARERERGRCAYEEPSKRLQQYWQTELNGKHSLSPQQTSH